MAFARTRPLTAALAGLFLLGACAAQEEAPAIDCPRVLVDEDVGSLTRFRDGPGRDITDIVATAEFSRIAGACEADEETLRVDLFMRIVAERGAAGTGDGADLPIFMAVVDAERRVISRRVFTERAAFPGNQSRAVLSDAFVVEIPRAPDVPTDSYTIYVGFELTRAEVEFNRQRSRRRGPGDQLRR